MADPVKAEVFVPWDMLHDSRDIEKLVDHVWKSLESMLDLQNPDWRDYQSWRSTWDDIAKAGWFYCIYSEAPAVNPVQIEIDFRPKELEEK